MAKSKRKFDESKVKRDRFGRFSSTGAKAQPGRGSVRSRTSGIVKAMREGRISRQKAIELGKAQSKRNLAALRKRKKKKL